MPYFRIVESYRNADDRVCHRTLLNIGFWEDITRAQQDEIMDLLNARYKNQMLMFHSKDEHVLSLAEKFWVQMIQKKSIDVVGREKLIKQDSIRHKEAREIGAEWLCYNTWNELHLTTLLEQQGWSEEKIKLAMTQVITRATYAASELASSKWIQENSAICDLTGYKVENINKDKLYRSALDLYACRDALEEHLSKRTNELFDLQERIMIYDLTNTYFEGRKEQSSMAQYGRSKEKRSDAKLIVLALVVNMEGFIKYSCLHEGNYHDTSDMSSLLEKLNARTTGYNPIIVMDAGIATESNLEILNQQGKKYMVVSRTKLSTYEPKHYNNETYLATKSKKIIRLQTVTNSNHTDTFIKVQSPDKYKKEKSMYNQFEKRFEDELEKIKIGLSKPRGIKTVDKVNQRIGRAKQKYPSASKYYTIQLTKDEEGKKITDISWFKPETKQVDDEEQLGIYFLRTNLEEKIDDEGLKWMIYNTIREVESTFRTLKTDLDLRPIYHQNDESTMAHLHLGILAYWLAHTIRYKLKQTGINYSWTEIIRIAHTQKQIITTAQNVNDKVILIKRCTEPVEKLTLIQQALKQKTKPFKTLKVVVHKPPPVIPKNQASG